MTAEVEGNGSGSAGKESSAGGTIEVSNTPVDESFYGLAIDPSESFQVARSTVKEIHSLLGSLKEMKGDGISDPASEKLSQDFQLQLVGLRRCFRSMCKAVETGKAAEANARHTLDAEFAFLETRRYESSRCKTSASYYHCFPHPNLTAVRPHLSGGLSAEEEREEEAKEIAESGKATSLTKRLDDELEERTKLADELQKLERQRDAECESLVEQEKFGKKLLDSIASLEASVSPVQERLKRRLEGGGADIAEDVEPSSKRQRAA